MEKRYQFFIISNVIYFILLYTFSDLLRDPVRNTPEGAELKGRFVYYLFIVTTPLITTLFGYLLFFLYTFFLGLINKSFKEIPLFFYIGPVIVGLAPLHFFLQGLWPGVSLSICLSVLSLFLAVTYCVHKYNLRERLVRTYFYLALWLPIGFVIYFFMPLAAALGSKASFELYDFILELLKLEVSSK